MNDEKKYLILFMLVAVLLLVAPTMIRLVNNNIYVVNSEAYNNMRLYDEQSTNYDSLQNRDIPFNVLNFIQLNDLLKSLLFKLIPILLGLITIFIAYFTLKKQNISEKTVLAILALIITSPIFIYVFTDYKVYSFIIFLNILGAYFLTQNKILPGSVVLSIIPFIDLFSGIMTAIILLIYIVTNPKNKSNIKIVFMILSASVVLTSIINIYYGYNLFHMFKFNIHNILVDIGANIGVSFSIIILTIIGMVLLWENGWRNLLTYILLFFVAILALFNDTIRIYLNFIIMIYAGFAFIYLNKRKWSIAIIKKTTILLIICSIFFSTLVYTTQLVRSDPSSEYIDALLFLKNQSLDNEVIFCDPVEGYFIEYYSNRTVFIDDSTRYYNLKKYDYLNIIASSRNLDRTEAIFKENGVKYVIISKNFEPYLKEKEGLLFLIETSNKFVKVYNNSDVEIWMYNY